MPIYEYQCDDCHDTFEKIMKFSDPHPDNCDTCGKGPVTKLMSPSSFHLKGGGWYSEGYDNKSNKKDSTAKPTASSSKESAPSKPKPAESKQSSSSPATKKSH